MIAEPFRPYCFGTRWLLRSLAAAWFFGFGAAAFAAPRTQETPSYYQVPPIEIVDILTSPPPPMIHLSPDAQWMLLLERDAMPDLAEVARRMLPLAGIRIDPHHSGRFETRSYHTARLRRTQPTPDGAALVTLPLPSGASITKVYWSHNSTLVAILLDTEQGAQLWRVSVDPLDPPRLWTNRINTVLMEPVWAPDGRSLLCAYNLETHGDEPKAPSVPRGPNIQESAGKKSPIRTYQDLLRNPHDAELFRYYATVQLALLGDEDQAHILGSPVLLDSARFSPDGNYLLVETLNEPFSYALPYQGFPRTIAVWDPAGAVIKTIAKVHAAEDIPIGGVRTGPRDVQWMASRPATLLWTEATDGGNPKQEAPFRDQVKMQEAPFTANPVDGPRVQQRLTGVRYFSAANRLITTEYDRDRRWVRSLLHDLETPDVVPRVVEDRNQRDRYGDPGDWLLVFDSFGSKVIMQIGDWAFRFGEGASPEGDLPFVDRYSLEQGQTDRLWRCAAGSYETPLQLWPVVDELKPNLITSYETESLPPNLRLWDLSVNSIQELTQFADPTPQIRNIPKRRLHYDRADGVPLSGTLYLPADASPENPLPLLIWAYPIEFNDAQTAGQVSGSEHRFTRMAGLSPLTMVTQGYAVLDGATMPILGDPETMNDTFLEQIVASAQAAIDAVVELGFADRDRVAVGGHSYGAFMTANLLAHCDLFRAGIARSGAYNRTLTPFGFQSERRPLWEALGVYVQISPFLHADKIHTPLLLIHGEMDDNPGTYPMQSERMYQAIQGNGGTVRLCMLPRESHGYRAKQSVLHTQAEMLAWLDRYVKPVRESQAPR